MNYPSASTQIVIPPLEWSWIPSVIVGLLVLVGAYLLAVGPLRKKYRWGPEVSLRQETLFLLGIAAVFIALCSPLDELGDHYLFAAHMTQHMLLTYFAPALLLAGVPGWLVSKVIPDGTLRKVFNQITGPIPAFILLNLVVWVWHIPVFYDATLASEGLHIVEHLTFIAAGLICWSPVLLASRREQVALPVQIFYLFASSLACTALAALLVFSAQPLYPYYAALPRAWGISPLFDQQLGGLIMWLPTDMLFFIIAILLFGFWLEQEDQLEPG